MSNPTPPFLTCSRATDDAEDAHYLAAQALPTDQLEAAIERDRAAGRSRYGRRRMYMLVLEERRAVEAERAQLAAVTELPPPAPSVDIFARCALLLA